jgi:predicted tellurium resistance membrane protein TerC
MAVVFISPKQRQRVFITGITVAVTLFCVVIAFIVFFSQPKAVSPDVVFNKPKVSINFGIFDSDQFTSLNSFEEMKLQFVYKAMKDGEEKNGYITAVSLEDERKMLEELGYNIVQLEEAKIGRKNPFETYKVLTAAELQAIIESAQAGAAQTTTTD